MLSFVLFLHHFLHPVLSISFTNISEAKGSLYIGVYDSESSFLQEKKVVFKKVLPVRKKGSIELKIPDLAPGFYAVSCFHDLNDNGKLDKNLVGIPSEPYGFSNNARPKFRAPKWEEAKFEIKSGENRIAIRLEKW
ncbi:MAG: DUF2141 domain-containing protein [Saprospiraceae bacterium]|nr:DUF2141 domain-containing protein [Saprospiraceae bacterium]